MPRPLEGSPHAVPGSPTAQTRPGGGSFFLLKLDDLAVFSSFSPFLLVFFYIKSVGERTILHRFSHPLSELLLRSSGRLLHPPMPPSQCRPVPVIPPAIGLPFVPPPSYRRSARRGGANRRCSPLHSPRLRHPLAVVHPLAEIRRMYTILLSLDPLTFCCRSGAQSRCTSPGHDGVPLSNALNNQ
jgi:hypothetical protein